MADSLPSSCGQRLRALRQALPVSMSALADAAGCSYGHYRMIEEGYRNPSPELATRIARALTAAGDGTVHVADFYNATASRRRAA